MGCLQKTLLEPQTLGAYLGPADIFADPELAVPQPGRAAEASFYPKSGLC